MQMNTDAAKAARALEKVNMAIIDAAGHRAQGHSRRIEGDRPAPSIAGARVRLEVISTPGASDIDGVDVVPGALEVVTPIGYKTARRSILPKVLSHLSEADPRRRVAEVVLETFERLGGARGVDLEGSAPKGLLSDGGVTTRIRYSEQMIRLEALANGWPTTRLCTELNRRPRVVLPVQRQNGKRQDILAFPAIIAMVCHGLSADEVLRRHGWAAKHPARKSLASGVLAALDDMADGMGFGRA